jgi:predicted metal-binding membrane protein
MPTMLIFARISEENPPRSRGFIRTWVFISSYLAAWTAYGPLAYGVFRAVMRAMGMHAARPCCSRR